MAKRVKGFLNLQVPAGAANPAPPIGPALGQRGLNIMEFCKGFNEKTKDLEKNSPVPVTITIYHDNSFTYVTRTTPVAYLLQKAAKIAKGSSTPGRQVCGSVSRADIQRIAGIKMPDLNADGEAGAMRMIEGTARSMGLEVTD